jgi:hypothetical protein
MIKRGAVSVALVARIFCCIFCSNYCPISLKGLVGRQVISLKQSEEHGLPNYFELEKVISRTFPDEDDLRLPKYFLWGGANYGKTALASALSGFALPLDVEYVDSFCRLFYLFKVRILF